MILVDFHAIMIAHVMVAAHTDDNFVLNENLLRHSILNSLRKYKQDFGAEYGKLLISCDGKNYWRKEKFPYYKINRKSEREDSIIDWNVIHDYMDKIKQELKEQTPFIVVEVDRAESDDIIATYLKNISLPEEKNLILSRDKDFYQLHDNTDYLKQYNPIDDKFIEVVDPDKTLFEHICKGDSSDGIPNIMSPKNSLAIKLRQKPMMQKKIDEWYSDRSLMPEEVKERFRLNENLISFSEIPEDIKDRIIEEYIKQINKPKKSFMNYFMKNRLSNLLENLQDFT
jgi:hypothetical protein